jgi:hypothetical protein
VSLPLLLVSNYRININIFYTSEYVLFYIRTYLGQIFYKLLNLCPYLAPEPFRGKRNSSLYIPEVVKKIAEIKQLDYDEVIDITFKNGRRMYGI